MDADTKHAHYRPLGRRYTACGIDVDIPNSYDFRWWVVSVDEVNEIDCRNCLRSREVRAIGLPLSS